MTCNPPSQEWTIDMVLDSPTDTGARSTLVFCLNVGDTITGNVDILSPQGQAEHLSPVTGMQRVQSELELPAELTPALMTLNFTWGDTQVVLSGNTLFNGIQNRFTGHFRAFASETPDPAEDEEGSAPSANDTGTGTGTQT